MKKLIAVLIALIIVVLMPECKKATNCEDTDGLLTPVEIGFLYPGAHVIKYRLAGGTDMDSVNLAKPSVLEAPIAASTGCTHKQKQGIQQGFFGNFASAFVNVPHADEWHKDTEKQYVTMSSPNGLDDNFVFSKGSIQNGVVVNGITYNNVYHIVSNNGTNGAISEIYFASSKWIIKYNVVGVGMFERIN